MGRRILMAVDGTERGLESVSIMGSLLKGRSDLDLVLFHCMQQLASLFPGELCLDVEKQCRISLKDMEKMGAVVLDESLSRLTAAGFPKENAKVKLKMNSMDPAQDIIAEAENQKIRTIALGRRGRSQVQALLLGSVSSKVAQYSQHRTVWIVDSPVNDSDRVLIAMEGVPECRELGMYAADFLAPGGRFKFTFLHLMPPVPPTFWDDGHILGPSEKKDRRSRIEKWREEWTERVGEYLAEGRRMLVERGVPDESVETLIRPTKEGIARDLLNEIEERKYRMIVMGKKSFHERKPFLMGSHANKVLQNAKGVALCLVDS